MRISIFDLLFIASWAAAQSQTDCSGNLSPGDYQDCINGASASPYDPGFMSASGLNGGFQGEAQLVGNYMGGGQQPRRRPKHPKRHPPTTPPTTTPPTTTPPTTTPPTTTPSGTRPQRQTGGPPAVVIESCTVPGTVAITFDDGPATTTHSLLDVLDRYSDVRVSFFINGNNYVDASLPEYQAVIARAYQAGHQIASHTYQHKDLTTLSDADINTQITKNDDIIYTATGRVVRYFRPPYGNTNDHVLSILGGLGLVVVQWNVDTEDWQTHNATQSAAVYTQALASAQNGEFIALEHDPEASTATQLMDMVIPAIRAKNLRMVTVAECLGDSNPYL